MARTYVPARFMAVPLVGEAPPALILGAALPHPVCWARHESHQREARTIAIPVMRAPNDVAVTLRSGHLTIHAWLSNTTVRDLTVAADGTGQQVVGVALDWRSDDLWRTGHAVRLAVRPLSVAARRPRSASTSRAGRHCRHGAACPHLPQRFRDQIPQRCLRRRSRPRHDKVHPNERSCPRDMLM